MLTYLFVQLCAHPGCGNNPNERAQQGEKKKKIINGYFSIELVSVNPNWGVQAVMLIDAMQRMMTGMGKSMKGLPKPL